jgi:hypothetical protein
MTNEEWLRILLFTIGFLAGVAFERLPDFDKDEE